MQNMWSLQRDGILFESYNIYIYTQGETQISEVWFFASAKDCQQY